MNEAHLSILYDLGLNEKEAKVYLATLELGAGGIAEIAARAGIKRTSVYNFIDHLVGLGIIGQSGSEPRTYSAIDPSKLAQIQEQRLNAVKERLPELTALANLSPAKPRIQYFEGTSQMQQIEREALNCKNELLVIWNRKQVIAQLGGKEYIEELDVLRRKKGIKIRLIAVKDEDTSFKNSESDESREIRWAPKGMDFPMGISIYDTGKVGFITSQNEKFGILIDSQELNQTMKQLFEAFWIVSTSDRPNSPLNT